MQDHPRVGRKCQSLCILTTKMGRKWDHPKNWFRAYALKSFVTLLDQNHRKMSHLNFHDKINASKLNFLFSLLWNETFLGTSQTPCQRWNLCYFSIFCFYALILVIIHGLEVSFFTPIVFYWARAGVFLAPNILLRTTRMVHFLRSSPPSSRSVPLRTRSCFENRLRRHHSAENLAGKNSPKNLTQVSNCNNPSKAIFYFHLMTGRIFKPDFDVNKVL